MKNLMIVKQGRLISLACFVMVAITLVTTTSWAQAPQAAPTTKPAPAKDKKTSVNFEDQLVEGQTQKPELFYLLQQRNNNFKRLIKLRENFLPEMRKTGEDVGRKDVDKGSGQ